MEWEEARRVPALPQMEGREEFAPLFLARPAMLRPACSGNPVWPAHDLETARLYRASPSHQHVFISYLICVDAALGSGTKRD